MQSNICAKHFVRFPPVAMEVHLLSGQLVASLPADELEGTTPRAVKQKLAAQVGVSRFRQRLFWEDGSEIPNDHVFAVGFVKLQLVKLEFWPSDNEEDGDMMRASGDGDLAALEELLHRPRDPNVTDDRGDMPLHHAARGGHLEPIRLLLEGQFKGAVREDAYPCGGFLGSC